jgi:hypothetical protein
MSARPSAWLWPLFVVTAFASTLCGIGGGLFAVPILHYLVGLPLKRAVASSMALVLVLGATSTAVELTRPDAALALAVVLPLVAGGFVGSRVGLRVASAISVRRLKQVFVVVLVLAGLRLLFLRSAAPAYAVPAEAVAGVARAALVALVGLAGGFVSPLLGVGGGLVVVPGLFLCVPGLDYLEARASALCMSLAIALYVTVVHARAGMLERDAALRYGSATLLGAVAGTLAVHQHGWAEAARVLLALVLLVTAARYAWDLRGQPQ